MVFYLNWKGPQGRETVDELERNAFPDYRAFRTELNRLIEEYAMAGMNGVYSSSRACKGWN
tara:strand:- start:828 stop:1010 length:183 start_codon:yes stop_codon:yes gene_type:complete